MHKHTQLHKKALLGVLICTLAIAFVVGAFLDIHVSANGGQSNSSKKALDIVFQGSWAFVQKEDGSIWAVTTAVDGHIYPYIRALNEAALGKDSFSLGFKADQVTKTNIDDRLKNSVPPNLPKVTVLQKQAYISFQLPKPSSIIVLHTDRQVLQDTDPDVHPGYDKSKEKDYPTVVAFRYLGEDFSKVDLLDTVGKKLTLDVPELGSESELFIGVQPAQADEDHSHAKRAFHELVGMLSPLQLYANFDPNDRSTPIQSGVRPLHHSGVDCYAAMLYVDCSGTTQCTLQSLK